MNKKQLIVIWIVVTIAVILLGVETKPIVGISNKMHLDCLCFYGFEIVRYDSPIFGYLVNIGHYKYQLIGSIILLGFALFFTVRNE